MLRWNNLMDDLCGDMITIRPKGVVEDIKVEEGCLVIKVELPGLGKEDVKVSASNQEVTIKSTSDKKKYTRTLRINQIYNVKETHCAMSNGILTVSIPQKEETKPVDIEIKED